MDWVLSLTEGLKKARAKGQRQPRVSLYRKIVILGPRSTHNSKDKSAKFASQASVITLGPLEAKQGPGHLIPAP